MSVLQYAQKQYPNLTPEKAILNYVKNKDLELESDVQNRLYGIKNRTGGYKRAGYQILRDFYEGDQWMYTREEGSSMNVINFCRMTVDNFTAFMTQEKPEIDIPPRDVKDDIELARVKFVESLVTDVLDDNDWFNLYQEGVQNGSLLGDTIISGPWYDNERKRIWFTNVKKPEFVRIIWRDSNYQEIVGFIYHYYMGIEKAEQLFGAELLAKGIKLRPEAAVAAGATTAPNRANDPQAQELTKRVLIREFFDDTYKQISINDEELKTEEHGVGFVPLIYIKNWPHPTDAYGQSDIEDLLDPNKSFNELDSDMQDIVKQVAFASIFGKNLDLQEIQAGVAKVYDMGDDSEVFNDPRNTNFPFLQTYLGDKKQNVDITSHVPDVFQGGKGVRDVSGRALSVLLTPINNRIRGKENRWSVGIETLVKNIEILVEKYIEGGRSLIQNHYKVDVFFPGTLIRDVTDELNKFIQKVQSQYTTMKNIGIASPKDEQEVMKKELSDPQLMVELSRSPQLQMALIQQVIAQARQSAADRNARSAMQPTLTEGQNQSGEMPASAAGVPVGTQQTLPGALASAASAGGGLPMMPSQ